MAASSEPVDPADGGRPAGPERTVTRSRGNVLYELDGKPGFETRELWLPTNSATRLEIVGSFADSGTLDVLTNDVLPAGDYRQAG